MSDLKNQIRAEIHHHIAPVIGWLRLDAMKGRVDTDEKRYGQWNERAELAVEAIAALVGEVEYEYNIEYTDGVNGNVFLFRQTWEPTLEWLKFKLDGESNYDQKLEYTAKLVKRRKAGPVEEA